MRLYTKLVELALVHPPRLRSIVRHEYHRLVLDASNGQLYSCDGVRYDT